MQSFNIDDYNCKDILNLFSLSIENKLTLDDIKNSKKKLLKIHPDKSSLPSKYFIFYKQAFDELCELYKIQESDNKTERNLHDVITAYDNDLDVADSVKSTINENFDNTIFNKFYDDHVVNKIDPEEYKWFQEDVSLPSYSHGDISSNMQEVKKQLLIDNKIRVFEKVQTSNHGVGSIMNLYEDNNKDMYISCDSNSLLQYADIRKVHKDESVFLVNEADVIEERTLQNYHRENHLPCNTTLETPDAFIRTLNKWKTREDS